ncbi:MAG: DEAD/DEAH box helicase [Gammaproteobacteria bacterium]|nr:DEAD/DEAH box helicase [Gammaproteobacteria bacterium]
MSFSKLGLHPSLLQMLDEINFSEPTPIQAKTIPLALHRKDIIGLAQTGTGKTAAFGLPILHQLADSPRASANTCKALILAPTRELAIQIFNHFKTYTTHLPIRVQCVYGGVKINPQMMKLRSGTEVLIATPGRLIDLAQQNAIKFNTVQTLVLDEADRMLDMGFIQDIRRIIKQLPANRQTMLFSATMSDEIRKLSHQLMQSPDEIQTNTVNQSAQTVVHKLHPVDKAKKTELLCQLLHDKKCTHALIFTKTKHAANKLVKNLHIQGIESMAIHGDKTQGQRIKALDSFKAGKIPFLIATDIASRGIDIQGLDLVINYELPQAAEDYIHRIGRTGRAGRKGHAISLVCADEFPNLKAIETLLKKTILREEIEGFYPSHFLPNSNNPNALKRKPQARIDQRKKTSFRK